MDRSITIFIAAREAHMRCLSGLSLGLALMVASLPATAAERRCGWYSPGDLLLTDGDGTWSIKRRAGNLPAFAGRGLGCACMTVDTNARKQRITRVYSGQMLPLSKCRYDSALSPVGGNRVIVGQRRPETVFLRDRGPVFGNHRQPPGMIVYRDRRPGSITYDDRRRGSITYDDNRPDARTFDDDNRPGSITYDDDRPNEIIYDDED